MNNDRVFSYLMTHDTGFAPNPFFGFLTLATCKPGIRKTKRPGDWIAGFASQSLVNNSSKNGIQIQRGALIYLMKVSEVMTFDQYFEDSRFQKKKPSLTGSWKEQSGDNIYHSDKNGRYQQSPNRNHDERDLQKDISGIHVLVAENFYYFGKNGVISPTPWHQMGLRVPTTQAPYGYESGNDSLQNLLAFLRDCGLNPGVHGEPCLWREGSDKRTCGPCSVARRKSVVPYQVPTMGRAQASKCS